MRRRAFLTLITAPLLAGATLSVSAQSDPAVDFVGELYTRQLQYHLARTAPGGDDFESLFTRDMRMLMNAPRINLAQMPAGPKLHAFFGWGVLPGMDIRIAKVTPANRAGWVRVDLAYRTEQHHVLVRPAQEDGGWRVADIVYENRGSLSERYRQMTGR